MRRVITLILGLCAAAALLAPATAAADPFGLSAFDVAFTDAEGVEVTQAGSHPFQMTTTFSVNTKERPAGGVSLSEPLKDLNIAQVAGFVGNPTSTPRCAAADFLIPTLNAEGAKTASCADSSALGLVSVQALNVGKLEAPIWASVYNLAPPPGKPAKFGFWASGVPVTIEASVSESPPYNIVAEVTNVSQILEVVGAKFTLWGVPADPAHDSLRGICVGGTGAQPVSFGKCPSGVSRTPFLTLPRACEGPLATHYEADSWEKPGTFSAKGEALTHDSAQPPNPEGMTGCSKLSFGPETAVSPSTTEAESASGLDIELAVDDESLASPDYNAVSDADIEATEFAFPVGMTLNPSAAEGLGVCTKAQYEAESLSAHGCPETAKLGSLEVETPILEDHTLRGSLYLAQQDDPETSEEGAENPFDSLFAAYLVIRDPELGVFIKLPSEIETDEASGQLIASVEEIPPFPLSRVKVHLRSGPRAPFVTPPTCGTYSTEALLYPSSGEEPLEEISTFQVTSGPGGGPCPPAGTPPFDPGFEAGTVNNAAGSFSPFDMRLTRADGQQDLTRFSATLPPGVVGKLAGVAKCPDAAIEAAKLKSGRKELGSPSCPASSQVGTVLAGAGVGTALTYVSGSLYLAGPYLGAPLSVAAIVPAVAGPFDVGTVVTRVGLTLNPTTAQVEVDGGASDPIPHILKGIPLKLRDLRVSADRPNFTLNPTSCNPFSTVAQIFGSGANVFSPADDVALARQARFQAASCSALGFGPKLSVKLRGGTKRNDHPSLRAVLTPRAGDANIASISTVLPHSEFIDPERISNPCTRVQFNENACPPASVLGTAKAFTPLLDEPLEGPVYFRSNGGERKVPDLVADVHGSGLRIIQVGFIDSVNARIRTRFLSFPDAPVSKILLTLKGGKEGVIVNSANLCAHKRHVKVAMGGQNGRRSDTEPVLQTSCKGKPSAKRKSARH